MATELFQLILLYAVIFDPLASFAVFSMATKNKVNGQIKDIALLSVLVAGIISFGVLLTGGFILDLLNTRLDDFRIAGGIILAILGIKMALGQSIAEDPDKLNQSPNAIAAIIGTPLLAGPAAITTIIISTQDYGVELTGLAIGIVLLFTGLLFLCSTPLNKVVGPTSLQVLSAILGLVTLAWGIKFIREGLVPFIQIL
ncbi:MAG: MarC family protein [Candidatus Hodarchaeales archaeon]